MIRLLSFTVILITLLSSCVATKKLVYLQNKNSDSLILLTSENPDYKLQPEDVLSVIITSQATGSNYDFFNTERQRLDQQIAGTNPYISGYRINSKGEIELPIIGSIMLQGLTIEEAQEKIKKTVNDYYKDAGVKVNLINYNITLLGEVLRPGRYAVYSNKITIIEAFGLAGDLTQFAKRKQIKVIRRSGNKLTIGHVDVTAQNAILSPFYYLQPNDIVYAEPLKVKSFRNWTIILSAAATLFGILNILGVFNK